MGIPEALLNKAYVFACRKFTRVSSQTIRILSSPAAADLALVTSVILLANPTHNSALNCRKLLIRERPECLHTKDELNFISCLLGHKQASKSSILWHHRRWIFRHIHTSGHDTLGGSPSLDDLKLEMDLVSKAAEIYPRNYHAWLHRYMCLEYPILQASYGEGSSAEFLNQELKDAMRWVELHVSDYTAINYLINLWRRLQEINIIHIFEPSFHPGMIAEPLQNLLVSHALSLIASYPTHESLWLYLRSACQFQSATKEWATNLADELNFDKTDVSDFTKRILSSCHENDLGKVKRQARLFALWTVSVTL